VAITTTAVNFAVSGALNLVGIAKSEKNSAVQASATASIQIPATTGMSAKLSPACRFCGCREPRILVLVNNTGNSADSYTATVMEPPARSQPSSWASRPANGKHPRFDLPGLGEGALLLETDLTKIEPGRLRYRFNRSRTRKSRRRRSPRVGAPASRGRRLGPG